MPADDDPKDRQDALVRAQQLTSQGKLEPAGLLLEKLVSADPSHLAAWDLLGYVRFFQKRYPQAEQCCRRALELKPGHAYALSGLALCLARQGRLDQGMAAFEKAIAGRPTWVDPYWDMALVLSEAGEQQKALQVLERGATAVDRGAERLLELAATIRDKVSSET